jgi:hypothetical protein
MEGATLSKLLNFLFFILSCSLFYPDIIHRMFHTTSLIIHPTSIIRHGSDSNPSLFHRPSLLVATPPPELPPGTTQGACKDGGGEALARLLWSGRCGGGGESDLASDGGLAASRQRSSKSGQAISASGMWRLWWPGRLLVVVAVAGSRRLVVVGRWWLNHLFSSSGSRPVATLRWNRVLLMVTRQIW